jgi:hypothetical protein
LRSLISGQQGPTAKIGNGFITLRRLHMDGDRHGPLNPIYSGMRKYSAHREGNVIKTFQALNGTTPIAMDGTWYFSSAAGKRWLRQGRRAANGAHESQECQGAPCPRLQAKSEQIKHGGCVRLPG